MKPGYTFRTFESNEQSVGTKRWERAPNRRSIPLRELYTVLFDSKGFVLQKLCKPDEHHRGGVGGWGWGVLQRLCSFGNFTNTTKKRDQPQASVESNFFMIIHLCTQVTAGTRVSLQGKHPNFARSSLPSGSCTM